MREALLPDERALILRATTEMNGHYDGQTIDCGDHAVAVNCRGVEPRGFFPWINA